MTTADLDHLLRNLEKQVNDFTLTMGDHQILTDSTNTASLERGYHSSNKKKAEDGDDDDSNQDDVPLQVYKTRVANGIPPVPPLPAKHTTPVDDDDDDDNMCIGGILQRSKTTRPSQQQHRERPTLASSKSLSGRNTKREEVKEVDKELRFAMQRAWAVLDSPSADTNAANTIEPTSTPANSTSVSQQTQQSDQQPNTTTTATSNVMSRNSTILKTTTTRIYIDDAKTFKVVQLTNLLTTAVVVQYLKKKGLVDNSDDWTLFEIDNSHQVERPLREWEIVLDILSVWDPEASNALLVKKYSYHYTLTSESVLTKKVPPMHGWLSIEYKKGKWQKRYCFVKDNAIHHAKDNHKGSTTSILCHLSTYDVYTLLPPLKASPTPYVFAIRAQDRSSIFEREGDYMRCLAVEDADEMKDWVLSIRCTKSQIQYQNYPNRVINPLVHIPLEEEKVATTTATIRRHKSMRDINSKVDHSEAPALPKSDSTRKVAATTEESSKKSLGRSNTTRPRRDTTTAKEPLINIDELLSAEKVTAAAAAVLDSNEPPKFSKGSLLAKEETPEQILYRQQQQQKQYEEQQSRNPDTLIHIDDRIRFAKGSLLDKKENGQAATSTPQTRMARSKSVREVSSSSNNNAAGEGGGDNIKRHQSLKRKPTNKKSQQQNHDVPLPNTTPINTPPPPYSPPSSSATIGSNQQQTLLQLGDTPERFHSRELHTRHVKPLLNFDSNEKSSSRK